MTNIKKQKLLNDYWNAHAQFGPLDVTPEQFITMFKDDSSEICKRCGATKDDKFCYCNA